MFFSIITPIYQCSKETNEFLESLTQQDYQDFEVILVEDGQLDSSREVITRYEDRLSIRYFFVENTSVSYRRNYGMTQARGDFFVFFDSDCLIPADYFNCVKQAVVEEDVCFWGGPDKDHESFSSLQKAINYSMTSVLTTGGIRGAKKKVGKYHPRSFNMGIHRKVYEKIGGFPPVISPGEDLIYSIQIQAAGFPSQLILEAFVYHKRKVTLKKYARQIRSFGFVRYPIFRVYPDTFHVSFLLPSLYFLGTVFALVLSFCVSGYFMLPLLFHYVLIMIDAGVKTRSPYIALLALVSSQVQFFAYGLGFLDAVGQCLIQGKRKFLEKLQYTSL